MVKAATFKTNIIMDMNSASGAVKPKAVSSILKRGTAPEGMRVVFGFIRRKSCYWFQRKCHIAIPPKCRICLYEVLWTPGRTVLPRLAWMDWLPAQMCVARSPRASPGPFREPAHQFSSTLTLTVSIFSVSGKTRDIFILHCTGWLICTRPTVPWRQNLVTSSETFFRSGTVSI